MQIVAPENAIPGIMTKNLTVSMESRVQLDRLGYEHGVEYGVKGSVR